MSAGYHATDLVVSRSYFQDAAGIPPALAPAVDGSDASIFVNTTYARGIVPLISETEWLAAWSALVEFWILFRSKFFTVAPVFPELDWVLPADFGTPDTSSDARLRVPSIRQLSQFMVHPDAFLISPEPVGLWVRRMELSAAGAIGAGAMVPFSGALMAKYNFPGDEILQLPEACGDLFDPTQGVFGSFGAAPNHAVDLFPYDPSNAAGLVPSKTRTRFIPALGSAGVMALLDLGLTVTQGALLDSHWAPGGVPAASGSLDFVETDDSILRMAFGGTPPADAVYVNLLRTNTFENPGASYAPSAAFRASPISLLLFLKSMVKYVAESSASYLPLSVPPVRLPTVSYYTAGQRTEVSRSGGGDSEWESTPCQQSPASGGSPIAGFYGNEESDVSTGTVRTTLSGAFGVVRAGSVTGTAANENIATYDGYAYLRARTITGSHTSGGSEANYEQCLGGISLRYRSSYAETSAVADTMTQNRATATLPALIWPEALTPWESTIFDLLKGDIGEPELGFLTANGFIERVSIYASVWATSVSSAPAGGTATITYRTTETPETPSETTVSAVEHSGGTTTPAAVAAAFLAPILSAAGLPGGFTPAVEGCTGSGEVYPPPSDDGFAVRDNSLSVAGIGPLAHTVVLLWAGSDLTEALHEDSAYTSIMEAVPIQTALEAFVGLAPAKTIENTLRQIETSWYRDTREDPGYGEGGAFDVSAANSTEEYSEVDTESQLTGSVSIRVGPLFAKIEYNFTHYRNLSSA